MRRAIFLLLFVAGAAITLDSRPAGSAQSAPLNGIGIVDYTRKPTFKVGDWVRYRMSGKSEMGLTDNYDVTVLIAGEEDFWGDPGFWIETWTTAPGRPIDTQAALMSYEIFGDSMAYQRLQLYMRKSLSMLNEDGSPKIDVNKPAAGILKARREVMNPVRWSRDSLGVDTVQTPKGLYQAHKVLFRQGTGTTQTVGDSTIYTELREDRTSWYVDEIPITHLGREDIETSAGRKTWMLGRSGESRTLNVMDRGRGSARLIDFGHGGLEPKLLPPYLRHTIAEQAAAERAASRPKPVASKSAAGGKPRR